MQARATPCMDFRAVVGHEGEWERLRGTLFLGYARKAPAWHFVARLEQAVRLRWG
jgi:hypothetical protein